MKGRVSEERWTPNDFFNDSVRQQTDFAIPGVLQSQKWMLLSKVHKEIHPFRIIDLITDKHHEF